MAGIMIDRRHCEVRIVRKCEIDARSWPLWRMARFDREHFALTRVTPILEQALESGDPASLRKLERLIEEFATTFRPPTGATPS
ncbi:hypothetical protein LK12_23365 [Novosphingobium malaysiense]|uniref:BLUF domain-containing protein n=2 Tax=Novosphingobium malaysiense TaxID=1348853 RepID=A0A0B1ZAR0_9SPHN|nr:hypothetical protein LK12_23365 [Novosphingobium malaysiense]